MFFIEIPSNKHVCFDYIHIIRLLINTKNILFPDICINKIKKCSLDSSYYKLQRKEVCPESLRFLPKQNAC